MCTCICIVCECARTHSLTRVKRRCIDRRSMAREPAEGGRGGVDWWVRFWGCGVLLFDVM